MSIFYPKFCWYSPTKSGTHYFAYWNEASVHVWQKLLAFPYSSWKDESTWISTDLTSLKTDVLLKLMFRHVGEKQFGSHGVKNQYLDWKIDVSIPHGVLVNTSSGAWANTHGEQLSYLTIVEVIQLPHRYRNCRKLLYIVPKCKIWQLFAIHFCIGTVTELPASA